MLFLRQFSILFFLLFFAIQSFSQDISGEWVGGIYLKDKNGEYKIYFPVHFAISFDTLTGNMKGTNTTKSFDTVIVDCNIRGVYDQKKQQYIINETEAIKSSNNKTLAYPVLNRFTVTRKKGEEEILFGKCECIKPSSSPLCYQNLQISLRRYKETVGN